ncbi:MAG: HK97 gp10 family phage protein [Eubacteriales bacterium]|nr:HK97 gp10 family phage protein [Eubacteriales bacterium]
MSVDGTRDLEKKLNKLSKMDVRKETAKAIMKVRDAAVFKAPTRRYGSGGGSLKQSIFAEVTEDGDSVIGVCYTNNDHAVFVEFGTGPVGQANHEKTSPDIHPAYSQTGWMMPGDVMDPDAAEQYGLGIAKGKNDEVIGYYTNGQPARPFMYPALKDNQDEILKDFATEFTANLERTLK